MADPLSSMLELSRVSSSRISAHFRLFHRTLNQVLWKWFIANVDVDMLTPTPANVGTYVGMLITAPQTKATVDCPK